MSGHQEIFSKTVVIEKPKIGLSKSHDDVIPFRVEPFKETEISKTIDDDNLENDEYFIIGNTGNIPLNIVVNYGVYNAILEVSENGNKLSANEKFNHFITLNAPEWQAGVLTISGTVTGIIPEDLIITTAPFTLETSPVIQAANVEVYVGYSNYQIELIPGTNVVFQYEKNLENQKHKMEFYQ